MGGSWARVEGGLRGEGVNVFGSLGVSRAVTFFCVFLEVRGLLRQAFRS